MHKDTGEICRNCKYWMGAFAGHPDYGLCRRYPPHIVEDPSKPEFPETEYYNYCGEFKDDRV